MAAAASASICASRKTEWADWNYLTSYGQSLSVGWTAKPVVTEKQEEGGLYMFRGGVRAYENGSDRKMLVPLEEGVNGPRGETPVSGAACRFTTAETISAIIADEAAIGMVNNKTTAVRIIPAPGKTVGDTVAFGGLLGSAPVMPVNRCSAADFIARGGRIPAPLHSLKN